MNTWVWRSNQNIWKYVNVQYFVNLLDLTPSFTTKELPRSCFAEAKVMCYTVSSNIHSSYLSEQFHMATSLCISHISSQEKESCPANNCMFKVKGTRTRQVVYNVYKVYNKDTGARSIDNVLVSLLLTVNIFHTLF